MPIGLIGQKLGMTQAYDSRGRFVPVTVIKAGPCPIVQLKTKENDGYAALQLGFGEAGNKKTKKISYKNHFKNSKIKPSSILKEFRIDEAGGYNVGENLTVEIFKSAETVKICGLSKGRGFAGVMKRHGFAGKDAGHGTHEYFRHGGSIGCRTPKHVVRGMKMPGRMGTDHVSVRNVEIIFVDKENNLLLLKGSIPGWNNGYVFVLKS
jgi:large subunit ribosomal protein L3